MLLGLTFPNTDNGMLGWSANVISLITPTPANWGLVVGDVTSYTALHTLYATDLAACEPSVRSKTAVVAKNQALKNLKNGALVVANKIYASPLVTDAMKVQIGMPPRALPQPNPIPDTAPVMEVKSVTGWLAELRLRDASGSSRGKPASVSGASIFTYTGPTPPTDISKWQFQGNTGRVFKVNVSFPNTLPSGTTVWFSAFWFNGSKQSGPACAPVSANLPGGTVSMAA